MQNPESVYISPMKENIFPYAVSDKPVGGVHDTFHSVVQKLKSERARMDRIVKHTLMLYLSFNF